MPSRPDYADGPAPSASNRAAGNGSAGAQDLSLDELIAVLGLAPHEVQVFDPAHPRFDAQRPLLVLGGQLEGARAAIAERYPASHRARAVAGGGVTDTRVEALAAHGGASAWLLDPLEPEDDARSPQGLRAIIERLYAPGGCPWDREQTHETLRTYLLEETYEALEAIDSGDRLELRDELGDLLMQVFFHAAIAQEAGDFTLDDVYEAISRKMVRRHPHVFADGDASDPDTIWARWEEIKVEERAVAGKDTSEASPLASVPTALPALQRAQSLLGRAQRAGLDEASASPIGALADALEKLEAAAAAARGEQLGALLWAAAAYARSEDLDAETALREHATRFVARVMEASSAD